MLGRINMTFLGSIKREFGFIKGNYAVMITSWIMIDFAMELPATYYALYVLGLGATETILGAIGLAQFLALASMQFPGGYLADKYGRKWLISTMTFGVALSFVFYALAPSWWIILIGAVLMSIFNSTYQPALNAMIADSLPPERRGMGFGIVSLIASASTTPSPAIAALLFSVYGLIDGMRIAYGIVVALFLVAASLRYFRLKETVVTASKPQIKEIFQSYPKALKESFGVWSRVPKSMLYLLVSFSIMIFGFSATNLYTVIYATTVLNIDKVLWALLIAIVPVTTIICAIPIGKMVDMSRRKIPLLASMLFFGLAMQLFVAGNTTLKVAASLVLIGVAQVMMNASSGALQADLIPQEERGKVSGFINFSSCIIMAVGSLVGGFLYEHVVPEAPFILAITMTLPSFLTTFALVKEPKNRQK